MATVHAAKLTEHLARLAAHHRAAAQEAQERAERGTIGRNLSGIPTTVTPTKEANDASRS